MRATRVGVAALAAALVAPIVVGQNNTADEIGSIQYTWRNFMNRISPTAIVIAILVSFILDGVVPLFTLLVVRPDNWY